MGTGQALDLPFIDEYRVLALAPARDVWAALTKQIMRSRPGVSEPFARVLGTEPRGRTGTLPEIGATIPGFAVTESAPNKRLTLTGRHRFSRYTLSFTLTERLSRSGTLDQPGGTELLARTHAAFPGPHGWAYRQAVIGSGAHRVVVRRLLRTVVRKAEARSAD